MKKLLKPIVLLMTFALVFSCGTDDGEKEEESKFDENASAISNSAEIKGASKVNGEPPAPNGGVSLVLVEPSKAAYEDAGLTIPISSDGDIVGAYLRFKTEDNFFKSTVMGKWRWV